MKYKLLIISISIILLLILFILIIGNKCKNEFNNYNNRTVYVSMTTLPERLITKWFYDNLKRNISMLSPGQILILHIPYKTLKGNKYIIPDNVKNLEGNNFIINRVQNDEGPITKILPALRNDMIRDDDIIIICDDDLYYKPNVFMLLEKNVNKYPQNVSIMCNSNAYSKKNQVQGYKGFAFVKKLLKRLINFDIPEECFKVDDNVISHYININNIKVIDFPYNNNKNSLCSVDSKKTNENKPKWYELRNDDRIGDVKKCLIKLNI